MGKNSVKPTCKFGAKCYRKNPQHLEEYTHPSNSKESESDSDSESEQQVEDEKVTTPPKKKTKIDEFFNVKAGDKEKSAEGGEGSGYKRDDEQSSDETKSEAKGQSSGYVREEELDETDGTTETLDAPPSPDDIRENIKSKFLVEMPEDFYDFWSFSETINKKKPTEAFKSSLGLQLVGPFDILAGKHKVTKSKCPCYHRHWRYYYDPPEFQTIIRGDDKTQFHMGYFRDDPKEMPAFVASNSAKENCTIAARGENIFAAILWFLEDKIKKEKTKDGPLMKLKASITEAATEKKYNLEQKTKALKARDKKVVCKSFHGAGLVVPVDENEVGYRPVPETPAYLKKLFKAVVDAESTDDRKKAMDPIMELIMLIQFANDECDYGEGLELGMDLFSYGGKVFHKTILNLLPLAYQLLGRMEYAAIIQAHLEDRKDSTDLSVL